jgi:hypothetical protein
MDKGEIQVDDEKFVLPGPAEITVSEGTAEAVGKLRINVPTGIGFRWEPDASGGTLYAPPNDERRKLLAALLRTLDVHVA